VRFTSDIAYMDTSSYSIANFATSHPRAQHYRRYLEVVLLAMLRVYLLPTPHVDRYLGRSPARMRPGDSPGPRRPFVGSGWTRTDRVERVLFACSARALAHNIARTAPRMTGPHRAPTGAARRHGLLPPTALPCAWPSVPGVSARFEMLQAATPWQPAADSSEPVLMRAEVPRAGCRRPRCLRVPYLPRLGLGIVSRASVPQHTLSVPQTRQRLV
jgi:hypothetical protein